MIAKPRSAGDESENARRMPRRGRAAGHARPGLPQASEELNALKSELEALRSGQAA